MGMFHFLKRVDFDQEIENYKNTKGAVLLDVRTLSEYAQGHVPESRNLPLQELQKVTKIIVEKDTPIYVYCRSGARSRQAAMLLKQMGYSNITDVGGIISYHGKVDKR